MPGAKNTEGCRTNGATGRHVIAANGRKLSTLGRSIGAAMKHPNFGHCSGACWPEAGQQECCTGGTALHRSTALKVASARRIATTLTYPCRIAIAC